MHSAQEIVDEIIWLSQENGVPLTPFSLQKLLYYTQGWSLVFFEEPLFDEPIEAWANGPVHRPTWERFESMPRNAVLTDPVARPDLPQDVRDHVADVMNAYSHLSGFQLALKTHNEEPWIEARRGLPQTATCRTPISHDTMRRFFDRQLELSEA